MAETNSAVQIGSNGSGSRHAYLTGLEWLTETSVTTDEPTELAPFNGAPIDEPLRELKELHIADDLVEPAQWVEYNTEKEPGIVNIRRRIIEVSERVVNDATGLPDVNPWHGGRARSASPFVPRLVFTINGQLRPLIDIQPGEIQRWLVHNAHSQHSIWLHVDGHTLYQIAQDNMPFGRIRPVPSIMLLPGNRAEVLVRANRPGLYRVHTKRYDHGLPGSSRPAADLATLMVNGRSVFTRLPRHLTGPPAIPTGPVWNERMLHVGQVWSADGTALQFRVDEEVVDVAEIVRTSVDTVEEWTLISDDPMQHLIHLDGNPFQVVEVRGVPAADLSWQTDPEIWWDTYRLPAHGRLILRIYFRPAAAAVLP